MTLKNLLAVVLCLGVNIFSLHAFSHEEDRRVEIEPSISKSEAGKIAYAFQLIDTKTKKLLTDESLYEIHEKKLHMLVYDAALKEFHHVHPDYKNNQWEVELSIPVDGKYWVWAQGGIDAEADSEEFSAVTELKITNGTAAWKTPPVLTDIREGVSGNSKVTMDNKTLSAGKTALLNLKFTRTDGTQPQISQYLGAFAHIVTVPDDGDDLLHVHPMNSAKPDMGMMHITFPRKGAYRIWVQFIDGNDLKVIPLSVLVN